MWPLRCLTTFLQNLSSSADIGLNDLVETISPDRKWLVFAQADYSGSNLMAVECFR